MDTKHSLTRVNPLSLFSFVNAAGAVGSAGKENAAPGASAAEAAAAAAQLKELRMENQLLQAELNNVADTAQTLKTQLQCVFVLVRESCC